MIRRALYTLAIAASLAVLALVAWRGRQFLSAVARAPVPPTDIRDSSRLSAEGGAATIRQDAAGGGEGPAVSREGAAGRGESAPAVVPEVATASHGGSRVLFVG